MKSVLIYFLYLIMCFFVSQLLNVFGLHIEASWMIACCALYVAIKNQEN
jgi:hypothetical protein